MENVVITYDYWARMTDTVETVYGIKDISHSEIVHGSEVVKRDDISRRLEILNKITCEKSNEKKYFNIIAHTNMKPFYEVETEYGTFTVMKEKNGEDYDILDKDGNYIDTFFASVVAENEDDLDGLAVIIEDIIEHNQK